MSDLRPPLPPHLPHREVAFSLDTGSSTGSLSSETISLIARALSEALPPGDFEVTQNGTLRYSNAHQLSAWSLTGRLDSLRGDER
jgi:hypothetical protein